MINEVEECDETPGYHERLHEILFDVAHLELHLSIKEADLSREERQKVSDLALHKPVQQYRALLFLKLADPLRFGQALAELKNHNLISKESQYPTDLLTALKLLTLRTKSLNIFDVLHHATKMRGVSVLTGKVLPSSAILPNVISASGTRAPYKDLSALQSCPR